MTRSDDPRDPPMAEPGKRQSGADLGGMRASADGGLGEATQRSMERGDDDAGPASTGDGSSAGATPRTDLGGKAEPGSAPGATRSSVRPAADESGASKAPAGGTAKPGWEDDDEPWRHAPVAPKDESPLKSFGRSISETVTGPTEDKTGKPKA
jgi:hypothetical protein